MVLIENVRGITYDFVSGDRKSRRNFAEELVGRLLKRYHVYAEVVRSSLFGVPQERPRFFIVGMLKSEFTELDEADTPFARLQAIKERFLATRGLKAHVTCKQAISDLELGRAGKGPCPDSKGYESLLTIAPRTDYQAYMRDGHVGAMRWPRLSEQIFRVDKWSLCRVRLPSGEAAA